jgi:hypothetical protein
MEGLSVTGTRSTTTIPSGEIGNEQPILLVTEHWYSAELQMDVLTKRSDPRSGESVTRLTNINRSEPARALFDVPSDFRIVDEMPRGGGANSSK